MKKKIEEKAKEIAFQAQELGLPVDDRTIEHGALLMAEWLMQNMWFSVEEKPIPATGEFVIAYHPKWVDEDFNPQGVRIGWMSDEGFCSAHWWDEKDDFIAISKARWEGDDKLKSFFQDHLDNSEPTHWMQIPQPPKGGVK